MSQRSSKPLFSTPIILAPLAGGPSTPELVAAVCTAGGFGFFGGAYLTPSKLAESLEQIRRLTDRPFGVNLFIPSAPVSIPEEKMSRALAATRTYRDELGLPEPRLAPPFADDFAGQMEVVLRLRPAAFSFTFGLLAPNYLRACRDAGILLVGNATSLDEALQLESNGVDAVVAQGIEAGGHRFIFSPDVADPGIATEPLVKLLCSHLHVPIIASGGIMDGRGIAAALALGAEAVQLGTAFLACPEAGTSPAYRSALLARPPPPTRLTRAFSGRIARGLTNRFLEEMETSDLILPFPVQNALTRDIRNEAVRQKKPEYLSLWAGQNVSAIRALPAARLVATLLEELREAQALSPPAGESAVADR